MHVKTFTMAALFAGVSISGCNCDIPFDETVSGSIVVALGSSTNCAFTGEETLDSDGNAITTDSESGTTVHYHYVNNDPRCDIVVDSWDGDMADLSAVNEQVGDEIENNGLEREKASISIGDVVVTNISLSLIQANDQVFDLSQVGPYHARAHIGRDELRVSDAILVSSDGSDPLNPEIVTTDDSRGLADAVQAAIDAEASLFADGDAAVEVAVADLGVLTDDGAGAPKVRVDYELRLTGLILVEVP